MFTLEPLNTALSKRHGQVEGDVMFVVTHHPQEFKLKLIQRLQDRKTLMIEKLYNLYKIMSNLRSPIYLFILKCTLYFKLRLSLFNYCT